MYQLLRNAVFVLCVSPAAAQPVEVVAVRSEAVDRMTNLPAELLPFLHVTLHARVNGYVEQVLVDRGSVVQVGNTLATIQAPELAAQVAEAESKITTAEAARAEAEARLAGALATFERLKAASATVGAIAGNELVQAEKLVEAARATVRSAESSIGTAKAAVRVAKQPEQYLQVTAPFSGVVTERLVHPGALVGPGAGADGALLTIEQVSRLRLVVPVPEATVAGIKTGGKVTFKVPAYPSRSFSGTVARINRSMDVKTRTMAVELDVLNPRNELAPGMFAEVAWPSKGGEQSLLVPPTAVVTTSERTFVVRVKDGKAEWVNVRKGKAAGETIEVLGNLQPGDLVVRRGSDEIRNGAAVQAKP